MNFKGKIEEKSGITMIGLIVTIIILLILVGVTLNLSVGEDGIIKKAIFAKDKIENSAELENIEQAVASALLKGQGDLNTSKLEKELKNINQNAELLGNGGWIYNGDKGSYRITNEGKVSVLQNICKIYGNTTSLLPEGYQQVEYLESSGTQYIDTGITPDEDYGFYIDFYFDVDIDTTSPNVGLLGSSMYNSGLFGGIMITSYAKMDGGQMTWFSTPSDFKNPKLQSKVRIQLYCINNIYKTSLGYKTYMEKSRYENLFGNIYIFRIHSDKNSIRNTTSHLKIYEYQTYKNSEIVQDLIPCINTTENELGMYDTITKQFFPNAGTETFFCGEEVTEYASVGDKNAEGKYVILVRLSMVDEEKDIEISLNEPLRKVGDVADYVDLIDKKVVRYINEDEQGNYSVLERPIEENISIEDIDYREILSISVDTAISPSKIEY